MKPVYTQYFLVAYAMSSFGNKFENLQCRFRVQCNSIEGPNILHFGVGVGLLWT